MQKTYAIFSGEELKIAEKIQQRRLQLLIHSCIYYEMNQNLITDKKWDEWARELKKLQDEYPEISRQVEWYAAFIDWDASTGAFLPLKNEWVVKKAKWLLNPEIKKLEKSNKPAVDKKTGSMKLF
jgi:hypothetical protein